MPPVRCRYACSIWSTSCPRASRSSPNSPGAVLEAALRARREHVDLVYEVPPEIVDACQNLLALLDEADDYCLAGEHLVTLTSPPEVRAYREWFLREFIEQVAGRPPTPWSQHQEPAERPSPSFTTATEAPRRASTQTHRSEADPWPSVVDGEQATVMSDGRARPRGRAVAPRSPQPAPQRRCAPFHARRRRRVVHRLRRTERVPGAVPAVPGGGRHDCAGAAVNPDPAHVGDQRAARSAERHLMFGYPQGRLAGTNQSSPIQLPLGIPYRWSLDETPKSIGARTARGAPDAGSPQHPGRDGWMSSSCSRARS